MLVSLDCRREAQGGGGSEVPVWCGELNEEPEPAQHLGGQSAEQLLSSAIKNLTATFRDPLSVDVFFYNVKNCGGCVFKGLCGDEFHRAPWVL